MADKTITGSDELYTLTAAAAADAAAAPSLLLAEPSPLLPAGGSTLIFPGKDALPSDRSGKLVDGDSDGEEESGDVSF